jgi:putative ABC transport system permease protein
MTDLQEAIRQLKKAPGFTATAVITLALGIGATTAIFTLVHQVMLKSLPVTKPEELWRVGDKVRCCNWGGYTQDDDGDFALFSWEAYRNFREHTPEFTDLAVLQAGNAALGVRRAGSQAPVDTRNGEYVSGNFFRTLGIQPWIGRLMTDDDDREGAPPVAVMSYHVWSDKYASDPSVVGASYQINGHAFTVIGVAPPGFFGAKLGGGTPDFWIPLATEPCWPANPSVADDRTRTGSTSLAGCAPALIPRRSKQSSGSSSWTGSPAMSPIWNPRKNRRGDSRRSISFPEALESPRCAIDTRPD